MERDGLYGSNVFCCKRLRSAQPHSATPDGFRHSHSCENSWGVEGHHYSGHQECLQPLNPEPQAAETTCFKRNLGTLCQRFAAWCNSSDVAEWHVTISSVISQSKDNSTVFYMNLKTMLAKQSYIVLSEDFLIYLSLSSVSFQNEYLLLIYKQVFFCNYTFLVLHNLIPGKHGHGYGVCGAVTWFGSLCVSVTLRNNSSISQAEIPVLFQYSTTRFAISYRSNAVMLFDSVDQYT